MKKSVDLPTVVLGGPDRNLGDTLTSIATKEERRRGERNTIEGKVQTTTTTTTKTQTRSRRGGGGRERRSHEEPRRYLLKKPTCNLLKGTRTRAFYVFYHRQQLDIDIGYSNMYLSS